MKAVQLAALMAFTVADYIPQGSRFRNVSADALNAGNGGFVCSFNAGVVTCTNGSLLGGNATTKIHILLYAPDAVNYDGTSSFTNIYTNHAVVDPNNNIAKAVKETSDNRKLVDEIYYMILSRPASDAEAAAVDLGTAEKRLEVAQDLAWALLNTPAFLFNR